MQNSPSSPPDDRKVFPFSTRQISTCRRPGIGGDSMFRAFSSNSMAGASTAKVKRFIGSAEGRRTVSGQSGDRIGGSSAWGDSLRISPNPPDEPQARPDTPRLDRFRLPFPRHGPFPQGRAGEQPEDPGLPRFFRSGVLRLLAKKGLLTPGPDLIWKHATAR